MEIKIDQVYVTSERLTKTFHLLVGKQEKEVVVEKWWIDYDDVYECDYEITEGKDKLTEEELEEVADFINELTQTSE